MILSVFTVAFLLSSCWAVDENNSGDDIPFLTSSKGDANEEAPLLTSSQGNANDDIPFVNASQDNSNTDEVSDLLPGTGEPNVPAVPEDQSLNNRGRSDTDVDDDGDYDEQPSAGYVYPKPTKAFNLPAFTTLDASKPFNAADGLDEENTEVERLPRSPRRRPPYFPDYQGPPPFIPGFIPPHNIRPLPALYGRY